MAITKTEKYVIRNIENDFYIEVEIYDDNVTIGQFVIPNENIAEVVHVLQGAMEKRGIPTA